MTSERLGNVDLSGTSRVCQAWPLAQFGGDTSPVYPHFFRRGGHNMPCPLHFFSSGFVFGEVSKTKVMLVTFCAKSFSC